MTFDMGKDLLKQLALLDLQHVLDLILSFLDQESLETIGKVSPLWAFIVQSSGVVYRKKVSFITTYWFGYKIIYLFNVDKP